MLRALGAVLGNQVEVGLPHVRADKLDLLRPFLADQSEELLEALFRALLAHPQQSHTTGLDRVDQRQIRVAFPIRDFVDPNCADGTPFAMLQTPLHHAFDRLHDLLPTGVKAPGGVRPRQLARPVRQIEHVSFTQRVLADAPRHRLDFHPAVRAIDPPHAVK